MDEEEEEGPPNIEDEKVLDHLTIKAASPYTEHFQQVEQKARINISKLSLHSTTAPWRPISPEYMTTDQPSQSSFMPTNCALHIW